MTGASPRGPGTHMGVGERGDHAGSFSGGCTEAAVVGEARRVLASGRSELIRLGAGSPLIDIRLPCGGGLDILLTPNVPQTAIEAALAHLVARRPAALAFDVAGSVSVVEDAATLVTGWHDGVFVARHDPDLRLVIVGQGTETGALAKLAIAFGAEVIVLSPDAASVDSARSLGIGAQLLVSATPPEEIAIDPFTALVFLFHDHEWEIPLIRWALAHDPLYIGAMGSRKTHERRLGHLRAAGASDGDCARVAGPIGLIPAARDPDTLALSVLSEIVKRQQSC